MSDVGSLDAQAVVRPVEPGDKETWLNLWDGYCTFYEATVPTDVTAATFERLLSEDVPNMFGLVAELDGRVVGFAHCVLHPNTWSVQDICYMEDLYVAPDVRGGGVGRTLVEAITSMGRAFKWQRIYWRTDAKNATAQVLYNKLADRTTWVQYEKEL